MTRLLSNIIKSEFIYVNGENKKIIDSNGRSETIRMIHFNRQLDKISHEDEFAVTNETGAGTFTEGLKATVISEILSEEDEKLQQQQVTQIISEAHIQAAQILKKAEIDAKIMVDLLLKDTGKKGYEDGLQQGIAEVEREKKKLDELTQKQNKEYLEQIETLEPQFGQIVSSLIKKITGIIVEDKKEVILYLIHNAMIHADNSKNYIIKVSKGDYDFVLSKKEELFNLISGDITIDVTADKDLDKNQCLIVTDTRIIDCSLDVQLSNLIQDIKLLSNQKE